MSKTVVLIHGAWLTPASWDFFKSRYEARGYTVVAPAWPYDNRSVEELRAWPRPELAKMTVRKIVDFHDALIRNLSEPPILIGHSFGGLFVQQLLDRGLGAAGIAIDPAAAHGVFPSATALYGALPIFLKWMGWRRNLTMTQNHFGRTFVQTLAPREQRSFFQRYAVPTPGRLYYQAAAGVETEVDFANNDRAPLLLISGSADRTVTPDMVSKTFRKYAQSIAITEFKSFPNRPHFLIATPGWEEVADYALDWAERHVPTQVAERRSSAAA